MLGDSSLLVLNGEAHRRHRKMLAPAFRGDGLRSHREMIRQIATDHQECLPQESTIRVYPFVQSLCLDIIVRVVFGDCGDALERLKRETGDLIESVTAPMVYIPVLQWDLGPGSPGRKIQTKLRNLDRSIQAEVSTRRAGGSNGRGGILDHLLLERDDDGEPLTRGSSYHPRRTSRRTLLKQRSPDRRLCHTARREHRSVHLPPPPTPRTLSGSIYVSSRTLPRSQILGLRVHSIRRRVSRLRG